MAPTNMDNEIDVDEWAARRDDPTYNPVAVSSGGVKSDKMVAAEATENVTELEEQPSDDFREKNTVRIVEVTDLSGYAGNTVGEQVEAFIRTHPVAIIAKSHCPFCHDVLDLLSEKLGVQVHVVNVDKPLEGNATGSEVQKHIGETYQHKTVPAVFCRGKFLGGCDDVKKLQSIGTL